jgi:hypothetical protein
MAAAGIGKLIAVGFGCMFFCVIILVIVHLSICIPGIIIGQVYRYQCPIENRIPQFLFNFQLINLCGGILLLLFACSFILVSKSLLDGLIKIDGRCPYLIPLILINFFLIGQFIYLIFGSIWTFNVYKIVQYQNKEIKASYCHKTLFDMTLSSIIIGNIAYLFYGIVLFMIWLQNCFTSISKKKRAEEGEMI